MSYSNGIITAPVSIYDIQRALGASSPDLGTLCKHANINMWAKYKPVRYPHVDSVTGQWDFTNNKWLSTAVWWKGAGTTDVGGITPFTTSVRATMLAQYLNSDRMNGWVYNKPSGGVYQPYRETDFACYNHLAPAPLEGFFIQDEIIQDGHFTASAVMSMTDDPNADYLSMGDFASEAFPNGLYFGVMFVLNGEIKLIVTSDTVDAAYMRVNFSGSGNMLPLNTTYTVYPILCRTEIPITQTSETSNLYLTCPNVTPIQTTIVDRTSTIDVELTPTYALTGSRVSVEIANNSGATITSVRWYITSSSAHPSSGGTSIGSIANGSTADVLNQSYTTGQYFHVSFRYSGATYWKSIRLIGPQSPT